MSGPAFSKDFDVLTAFTAFSLPDFIAAAIRQRPHATAAGELGDVVTTYLQRSPELVIAWLLTGRDPDPGELTRLYEVVSAVPGRAAQTLRLALALASHDHP